MSVALSVTVRAFADRRLLRLDASDGVEDQGELPFRPTPTAGLAPPGRQGCWLHSDQERSVTVELNVHDAVLDVGDGFEHAEFDGGGEQLALRGLFGDPYAIVAARAQRWHLAAIYHEPEWSWRLHLWPVETPVRASADEGDLFVTGTTRIVSGSGAVVEEPYVSVTVTFDSELAEDRIDSLTMWLDQEIHLPGLDYTVQYSDLDTIRITIRSAVSEQRLDDLCQRVDATLGRILPDVPFRTTYR